MYEDIDENNEVMLKITYVNIYHSEKNFGRGHNSHPRMFSMLRSGFKFTYMVY
jgi:hypothetical protein